MVPLRLFLITSFGLGRQSWRSITVLDLENMLKAIGIGTALGFAFGLGLYETLGFPRTVPLISGLLAVLLMGGARLAVRLHHERGVRSSALAGSSERRVLLVGAGEAGSLFARELRRNPVSAMRAIGFLDDDPGKQRQTVSGLPVLGRIADLAAVCAVRWIDEVLIAMPSAPGRETRRVVEAARAAGVPCRILPGVTAILAGDFGVHSVREVLVEDLLRRRPAALDFSSTGDYLRGSSILVTGAGGSIGAEIVRQVARSEPARVILFGQGENSLHLVQQELDRDLPGLTHVTVVGSVRDRAKLDQVMRDHGPDVVFHAAAHKHVPMMEADPDEAVLNNVGGTRNVAEAALKAGVQRFVNISTDKAVHPTSVLGVTKSVAESVVRALAVGAGTDQAFVSVRFGNVLGSRGSVDPGVPGADPPGRADHDHRRARHAVLHDDPRGLAAGPAGRSPRRERGGLHPRHGGTRPDHRARARHDPAVGPHGGGDPDRPDGPPPR